NTPLLSESQTFNGVMEEDFRELISMAEIGFVKGIDKVLKRIELAENSDDFITHIRYHLENFQFPEIISISKKGLL
ncbi:MAG: hypothetical protein ACI9T9_000999, partial [Oleiphilaceae bacterium]